MSPPLVQKQPPPLKWANQCASLCHCVSSLAHLCCLCHGAKSGQHNMEYSPHRCLLSQQGRDWNRQSSMHPPTCTAGLDPQSPVDAHEKSISGKNQKGCDLRQTQDKVRKCSRRDESRFSWTIFVWFIFDLIFQNIFRNIARTKIFQAESDSPRRILLCQGLRSFWSALVRPGIYFLVF